MRNSLNKQMDGLGHNCVDTSRASIPGGCWSPPARHRSCPRCASNSTQGEVPGSGIRCERFPMLVWGGVGEERGLAFGVMIHRASDSAGTRGGGKGCPSRVASIAGLDVPIRQACVWR